VTVAGRVRRFPIPRPAARAARGPSRRHRRGRRDDVQLVHTRHRVLRAHNEPRGARLGSADRDDRIARQVSKGRAIRLVQDRLGRLLSGVRERHGGDPVAPSVPRGESSDAPGRADRAPLVGHGLVREVVRDRHDVDQSEKRAGEDIAGIPRRHGSHYTPARRARRRRRSGDLGLASSCGSIAGAVSHGTSLRNENCAPAAR